MAWYGIAAIVVLIVLIVYCVFSCIIGVMCLKLVVKPTQHLHQEEREADEQNGLIQCFSDYDHLWERHDFTIQSDDVALIGEYIVHPSNTGKRKKVAIICHGHTVNRICAVKYAKMFYDIGYSVVIYDARYFGASSGDYSTLGQNEEKDLVNVIAYTKKIFGEDAFIGLHGESMGGATVLLVLKESNVDFVVADCPFASSRQLFKEQLTMRFHIPMFPCLNIAHFVGKAMYHYDFYKVNPMEGVAHTDVPICFIHGKADSYISPKHSETMYIKCKNKNSELHLVDGAEHAKSCVVDTPTYEKILQAFVQKIETTSDRAPIHMVSTDEDR